MPNTVNCVPELARQHHAPPVAFGLGYLPQPVERNLRRQTEPLRHLVAHGHTLVAQRCQPVKVVLVCAITQDVLNPAQAIVKLSHRRYWNFFQLSRFFVCNLLPLPRRDCKAFVCQAFHFSSPSILALSSIISSGASPVSSQAARRCAIRQCTQSLQLFAESHSLYSQTTLPARFGYGSSPHRFVSRFIVSPP